jgi:hypothetical protein
MNPGVQCCPSVSEHILTWHHLPPTSNKVELAGLLGHLQSQVRCHASTHDSVGT